MEQKLEAYSVFEDYYDKKFGEKVRAIPGYEIIKYYWSCSEPSIFGHRILKYPSPLNPRDSYFNIKDVGVISDTDYLLIRSCNDIEIMNKDIFKMLYTKNKRIVNKFIKIERRYATTYIEVSTINNIIFVKNDKEKYLWIKHGTGGEIINSSDVLNYDEVEEILKNYVEE